MTDPLSITASLIAVIQLTRKIGSYLCGVRDASKDSRQLLLEVTAISGLVYQLKYLADDVGSDADWTSITQSLLVTNGPLDQLKGALERLKSKLDQAQRSRIGHALRWPFTREEVKETLDLISRLKLLFVLALQNDQMALSTDIRKDLSALVHQAEKREAEDTQRRKEEVRHNAITWISPISFKDDHEELLEAWQKWYPETNKDEAGAWLLSHDLFCTWEAFQGSSILWVNGKPGSGKSVLASRVVKHFEELPLPQKHGLGYVYCSSREMSKRNPTTLASCILQQLCSQSPTLDNAMLELYQKYLDWPNSRPGWLEVTEVLMAVLSNFHQAFFVIDGLDECADQKKFASVLFRIHELSKPITKIIFFSRSAIPPVEAPFHRCYNQIIIDSGLNRKDIELYTTIRLASLSFEDEFEKDNLTKNLIGKADGMFLWVHLQIEAFTEQRDPDILTEIPRGLQDYFERSLRRTHEYSEFRKRTASHILFWAVNAKRPLHTSEIIQAISISTRSDINDSFNVDEFCAGLVQLDKNRHVQLFHSSGQELLTSGQIRAEPGSILGEFKTLQDNAASKLANACLKVLLLEDMRCGPAVTQELFEARIKKHPLYLYAARFWAHHIRDSPQGDYKALLDDFLSCPLAIDSYVQAIYASADKSQWDSYPRNRTALHVIANFGLIDILKKFPEAKKMAKQRDSWGWKAVDLAFTHGRRNCCLQLLSLETFINEKMMNEYPLHKAIEYEWPEVIERLLHMRADLDLRYTNSYTPLHMASRHCGDTEILNLLLEASADVKAHIEARTSDQATPLMLAAEAGNLPIVKALIEAKANLKAKNAIGETVLHYAARSSRANVVEMLAQSGLSPNVSDVAREAPLHIAAMGVHVEVVDALISAGADVNAVNIVGNTPLHVAAAWRRNEVILTLIRNKADPLLSDDFYWNTIHIHAFMKNLAVIEEFEPPLLLSPRNENDNTLARINSAIQSSEPSPLTKTLTWTSNTPLFFYTLQPEPSLLLSLLSSKDGPDPNTVDRHGVSLLHVACAANSPSIVSALLSQGANINAQDQWGRKPYSLAVSSAAAEVRALLAQHPSFVAPEGHDPSQLEVQTWWTMQHVDRNFCLYVRCTECGLAINGTFVHCTRCTNERSGHEVCEKCVRAMGLVECRAGHGCPERQVLMLRDHMLSFVEGIMCVHDLLKEARETEPEAEQEEEEEKGDG